MKVCVSHGGADVNTPPQDPPPTTTTHGITQMCLCGVRHSITAPRGDGPETTLNTTQGWWKMEGTWWWCGNKQEVVFQRHPRQSTSLHTPVMSGYSGICYSHVDVRRRHVVGADAPRHEAFTVTVLLTTLLSVSPGEDSQWLFSISYFLTFSDQMQL